METLTLRDRRAEAVVVPALGAGLARYDLVDGPSPVALFRPCESLDAARPFDLAHNLLVPWSGRISGGGFTFGNHFHPLVANLHGEPLPIHGSGFAVAWTVAEVSPTHARLTLASEGPGPYRFDAAVTYGLDGGVLSIDLSVTSRAAVALPHGLGLHPWFPRTPGTRLRATATTVTLEDSRHLPAGQVSVASRPDWDFNQPRRLPGAWINNDFSPWDGHAEIAWPEHGVRLRVDTGGDPHLRTFILYSPASDAPFFCFEPVTHPVDAHNRVGGPASNGLVILEPAATLAVQCRFVPERL